MSKKKTVKAMNELLRIDLRKEYRHSLFGRWEGKDLSATIISATTDASYACDDSFILSFVGETVIQSCNGGHNWDYYRGPRHWPKANMIMEAGKNLIAINSGREFCRSYDGGITWGKKFIIPSAKDVHFDRLSGALCFSGILTRRGRIVLANSYWTGQEGPDGELLSTTTSDDWGQTWEVSRLFGPAAPLPYGPEGFGEPAIVEMKSGWLWMVFRTLYGELWQAISQDGGLSWGPPTPTGFTSPIANCYAARHPDSGATVLAWNMTIPGTDVNFRSKDSLYRPRTNLVFSISHDNCRTWSCPVTVEKDQGLYPRIFFSGNAMFIIYQSSHEKVRGWSDYGLTLVGYDKTEVDLLFPWTVETIQPYIDAGLVANWRAVGLQSKPKETVD